MNDFTKEDLEDLDRCVNLARKQDYNLPSEKGSDYLLDKIQSMIKNYCEHDPEGEFIIAGNFIIAVNKCSKCGITINDN